MGLGGMIIMKRWDLLLAYCYLSAAVEKIVTSSNFDQRDLSSGIGMTPFYRGVGEGGHHWPAYQRINSNHQVRTNPQAGLTEDPERTVSLTVDEMREFLRKLSRNNNFAAGREIKWGV